MLSSRGTHRRESQTVPAPARRGCHPAGDGATTWAHREGSWLGLEGLGPGNVPEGSRGPGTCVLKGSAPAAKDANVWSAWPRGHRPDQQRLGRTGRRCSAGADGARGRRPAAGRIRRLDSGEAGLQGEGEHGVVPQLVQPVVVVPELLGQHAPPGRVQQVLEDRTRRLGALGGRGFDTACGSKAARCSTTPARQRLVLGQRDAPQAS